MFIGILSHLISGFHRKKDMATELMNQLNYYWKFNGIMIKLCLNLIMLDISNRLRRWGTHGYIQKMVCNIGHGRENNYL